MPFELLHTERLLDHVYVLYQCEDDAQQDHEADLEVGEEDEGDDEDADHGQTEVTPKLETDDLVSLPRRVDLYRVKEKRIALSSAKRKNNYQNQRALSCKEESNPETCSTHSRSLKTNLSFPV